MIYRQIVRLVSINKCMILTPVCQFGKYKRSYTGRRIHLANTDPDAVNVNANTNTNTNANTDQP